MGERKKHPISDPAVVTLRNGLYFIGIPRSVPQSGEPRVRCGRMGRHNDTVQKRGQIFGRTWPAFSGRGAVAADLPGIVWFYIERHRHWMLPVGFRVSFTACRSGGPTRNIAHGREEYRPKRKSATGNFGVSKYAMVGDRMLRNDESRYGRGGCSVADACANGHVVSRMSVLGTEV